MEGAEFFVALDPIRVFHSTARQVDIQVPQDKNFLIVKIFVFEIAALSFLRKPLESGGL